MFCSTIIPTVGRTTLDRAVTSVLEQAFTAGEFEVIVVNDSGRPLRPAGWQQAHRVRIIETQRRERSVARNAGAAIATGRYLHFLDDDDWLLPGALTVWWELAQRSQAAWIYGSTRLIDRHGQDLLILRHGLVGNAFVQVMAGEWIALAASAIQAEVFFTAGGFEPTLAGPEDIDLLRRIALSYELAETAAVVAAMTMGEHASTTDWSGHAAQSRWAREQVLDQPGAFSRMRKSAAADASATADAAAVGAWQGRMARIYLTSALWNVRHRRLWTAASRAAHGLAAVGLARTHLLSGGFWRAVATAYQSASFARGR